MTTDQFEIIDVHLHAWAAEGMGPIFDPHMPTTMDEKVFADTLAQMDALGIRHALLSGANHLTVEWSRRAPGRFIPAWWPPLCPEDPEAEAARFLEAVETQGFRALGENIMQYAGLAVNDARYFPLYRVCAQRRLPVICHTGLNGPDWPRWAPSFRVTLGDPLLLEDVLAAFPDLVIVMCHMSWPFTEQAAYMLYAHSNVYMDVSCVNWILGRAGVHRLLRQVVETVGPDKILFGTDQMGMPAKIPIAVSAIREATFLSEEDKRKILGDNARRLLGLGETQPTKL
jgi:predicted TIM-barrel fold metal-dependent hydrolase